MRTTPFPILSEDSYLTARLERVVGAKSAASAPPGRRSSDLPHLGRTWDYSWADSVVGIRMTEPFFFIKHPSAARTFRRRSLHASHARQNLFIHSALSLTFLCGM